MRPEARLLSGSILDPSIAKEIDLSSHRPEKFLILSVTSMHAQLETRGMTQ
jgi:hypothetical protein